MNKFEELCSYWENKDEELRKAVEILKKHNVWRRYNGPIDEAPMEMENPKELGKAIDLIVNYLEEE